MTSTSRWEAFFSAAGLPRRVSLKYASLFVDQRIQEAMLEDIDKATLVDLGIATIGDQIAILHHIRARNIADDRPLANNQRQRNMRPISKPPRAAPDRDDIYHIRMPAGTTPKTRVIMQQNQRLRTAGLLKRGFTGVRQSGKNVRPPSSRRRNTNPVIASAEVSSTTSSVYERLGVQGLVSDQLSEPAQAPRTFTAARPRHVNPRAANAVATMRSMRLSAPEAAGGAPVFRVRIPANNNANNNQPRVRPRGPRGARVVIGAGAVRGRLPMIQRISVPNGTPRPRPPMRSVFSRLG